MGRRAYAMVALAVREAGTGAVAPWGSFTPKAFNYRCDCLCQTISSEPEECHDEDNGPDGTCNANRYPI